uniref:N-acetylgalactosaminide beta-1,3-galactosyltransferase n=1 Tax=Strongyloides stercoralis TaxID=6248 RepID=A0A0K0EB81_STRER
MKILTLLYFVILFINSILIVRGYKFKCSSFFGSKPPCFLQIYLENHREMATLLSACIPAQGHILNKLYKKHFFDPSVVSSMNKFAAIYFTQTVIYDICRKLKIKKCRHKTYVSFYLSKRGYKSALKRQKIEQEKKKRLLLEREKSSSFRSILQQKTNNL